MATHTIATLGDAARNAAVLRTDILVRGTGAPAGLLAAALARGGRDVVLLRDRGGERRASDLSTVPYTAELALLIATRFGVPEAASIAMFDRVTPALADASAEKTSLGFCHHRARSGHDPAQAVQFQVPGEHGEWQPDRAALGAWAAGVAAAHGATVVEGVHELDADADGVRARRDDGPAIAASLLVDGAAAADRDRDRARVLSADLSGVQAFERVIGGRRHGDVRPWSAGTLIHTFAGGYVQVCHHGESRPAGVSVVLDPRVADPELRGASQVAAALAEFPDLCAQLAHAQPLHDWEDSWAPPPASVASGPRVLALDAGGGREPLHGRELTLGLEAVLVTAAALLDAGAGAGRDGDAAAVGAARARIAALTAHEDRHAAALLTASRDFGLLNALLRVWLLESIVRALALKRARLDAAASGSFAFVDRGAGAFWFRVPHGLRGVVESTLGDVEAVTRGELPASAAARRVFERLGRSRITPPLFDFADPDARVYRFTATRRLRMLAWVKLRAPADFRGLLTRENVTVPRPSH